MFMDKETNLFLVWKKVIYLFYIWRVYLEGGGLSFPLCPVAPTKYSFFLITSFSDASFSYSMILTIASGLWSFLLYRDKTTSDFKALSY